MKKIRVVELFAGVGGFRLGLEQASDRFETVWANQWEPSMREQWAYECYSKHFGKCACHVCKDISHIDKAEIPDHDLLVGGFPCQDYSIAKKDAQGIEGKKGVLWWQIDEVLQQKRPPYVLLENVDRLIRSPAKQKGRDFSIILRCFYEKGYAVEWRVINAADHGQAQRRRRTFLLAYHHDTEIFKDLADETCRCGAKGLHTYIMKNSLFAQAFPIKYHGKKYFDNWIDEFKYEDIAELSAKQMAYFYNAGIMMNGRIYSVDVIPEKEPFIPLKNILERSTLDKHYFLKECDLSKWKYIKGAKREQRNKSDGTSYLFTEGSLPFPELLNMPSRTMLTGESTISRTSHVVKDPLTGKLRTLIPVECERLNGFPDGWTEGMPERMRYFTMGNALVVPLVVRIGKALDRMIFISYNLKIQNRGTGKGVYDMDIPKLKKSSRDREFMLYTPEQRAKIVWGYLFQARSHRQLDEEVLGLDGTQTRGWQSMGVLHYLGLVRAFKGLFKYLTPRDAIKELSVSQNDDYTQIIDILKTMKEQ